MLHRVLPAAATGRKEVSPGLLPQWPARSSPAHTQVSKISWLDDVMVYSSSILPVVLRPVVFFTMWSALVATASIVYGKDLALTNNVGESWCCRWGAVVSPATSRWRAVLIGSTLALCRRRSFAR